jgi:hypothetical protein
LLPADRQVDERNLHAMLQRLNDIFVRSGSGIYGLAEWGVQKDRTISDAAYRILQASGEPLPMRELTERVLAQRQVRASSVQIMVSADSRFCRFGPKIGLCEWRQTYCGSAREDISKQYSTSPSAGHHTENIVPNADQLEDLVDMLLGDL